MEAHWSKIGFKPETEANIEVDYLPELDIQVGYSKKENTVHSENSLQSRYKSVIIRGFLPETSLKDAVKVISEHCVPSNFNEDSVSRNGKTGVITITNLMPDQCLDLMGKNAFKKVFGEKNLCNVSCCKQPFQEPPFYFADFYG